MSDLLKKKSDIPTKAVFPFIGNVVRVLDCIVSAHPKLFIFGVKAPF
jgi:hypothetical protein